MHPTRSRAARCTHLVTALLLGLSLLGPRPAPAETASGLYEDALVRFSEGDPDAAEIQLKRALQFDPNYPPARILLGKLYLLAGKGFAAEKELRLAQSAGADPNLVLPALANALLMQRKFQVLLDVVKPTGLRAAAESKVLTFRGRAALKLNWLDDAEEAFTLAAELDPGDVDALLGQADVLLRRAKVKEAETLADTAAERAPRSTDAWMLKGEIDRIQGNFEAAVANYDRVIELAPLHLPARTARAAVLIDLDRDAAAGEDLKLVRELAKHDPQASYLYSLVLARAGDDTGAREALREADLALRILGDQFIESDPPTLLLSGIIRYGRGNFEEAYQQLKRFSLLNPENTTARKLLGSILIEKNDLVGAAEVLEPAFLFTPNDPLLYALEGSISMKRGEYDAASTSFERAVDLAPNRSALRTELAFSRLAAGEREAAIADLDAAVMTNATETRAQILLGLMHLRRAEYGAAERSLSQFSALEPDNPTALNLLASAQLGNGDLAAARATLERALQIDPRYNTAQLNLAKLDLGQGRLDGAKVRLEALLERDPEETRAMDELARIAEREERLPDAIRWLEKSRDLDRESIRRQLGLLDLYLRAGETSKALEVAQELESRQPNNLDVLTAVGRVEVARGEVDRARVTFKRMSELVPNSPAALYRISQFQMRVNDPEHARWSLVQALQADPDYLPARAALVEVEAGLRKYDEALQLAEALARDHPALSIGEVLQGDVLSHQGRFAEAATAYASAQAKEPTPAGAVRLFQARWRAGERAVALASLGKWVETHPSDPVARRALASGLMASGDARAAIKQNEILLAASPGDAVVLNNLALLYFAIGDARALEYAERAHSLAPTDAAVLDTLGWLLVKRDQPERGLTFLREAHSRLANDPRVRYHLAVALSRLGRTQEARRELERALQSGEEFEEARDARALLLELKG